MCLLESVCVNECIIIACCMCVHTHTNAHAQDDALRRLLSESDLLQQTYGHFFNLTIVNNDIDDTIEQLQNAMRETTVQPQWIPVKWVY